MDETILSICIGIGLSAACGFRVFVPLLVASIAARTGHGVLASQFAWASSDAALIALGVATALEIAGYYIPWVDHLLDTIATPAAVTAGIVITGAMLSNMDPYLRWTLAVIAGGGVAGGVQAGTVLTRAASTATTGGLGNPLVATAELGLSLFTSVMAVLVPIIAALLVLVIGIILSLKVWKRFRPQVQT
jgi:hypothetical protein